MASIDIRPLQDGLTFGSRITGVTRDRLQDEEVRQQIRDIFIDRGVILFEDMEVTGPMQVMLSNVIGPLKDHPVKTVERVNADEMLGVIAIRTHAQAGIVEIDGKPLMTYQPWHFDHSYNNELNRAGVLRAETIAPTDGLTGFADGIQIYRDMDPVLRAKIEDLTAIYSLDLRFSQQRWGLPKGFRELRYRTPHDKINEMAAIFPRALHPAVWTRETGEKVVHMSPYGARGFEGMENAAGDALFEAAWNEIERVLQPYYHSWRPTDMMMWDNWRILHMACGCSPEHERVMHRTTIKGDYGLGRWETEPTHLEPADSMA
jgi:taurine dioxygenase